MNVDDFMAKSGIADSDLDRMAAPYENGSFELDPVGKAIVGSHLAVAGAHRTAEADDAQKALRGDRGDGEEAEGEGERGYIAADGRMIIEAMIGKWCDAYERGGFPEGERAVGGAVDGRMPEAKDGRGKMGWR